MASKALPCPTVLRQLIALEGDTLVWRHRPMWMFKRPARAESWNREYAGHPVGLRHHPDGYMKIKITGSSNGVYAHRVVFALHHRKWPGTLLDHINGDREDNRIENLREADAGQNARNAKSYGRTSKFRGVSLDKTRGLWHVKCTDSQGRNAYVGKFKCEIEAARAYDSAARAWHGEFARLNFP